MTLVSLKFYKEDFTEWVATSFAEVDGSINNIELAQEIVDNQRNFGDQWFGQYDVEVMLMSDLAKNNGVFEAQRMIKAKSFDGRVRTVPVPSRIQEDDSHELPF